MRDATKAVTEFHHKMGQHIADDLCVGIDVDLRLSLIEEEVKELRDALTDPSLSYDDRIVAVADALADISYVVAGSAVTWGIDLGAVFDEVHRSNMTKSAGVRRADGKILKGLDYSPPDIKRALGIGRATP